MFKQVNYCLKPKRPKAGGRCNHITLKCRKGNITTYVDDERINTDPGRASEYAIRKHQRAYGIRWEQALFTIADYPNGHYLIYDNMEVVAYTVITTDVSIDKI